MLACVLASDLYLAEKNSESEMSGKEKNKENEDPNDRDFVLPKEKNARFNIISTNSEIEEISKGYVPVNTKRNTSWSMKVFSEW